jgi:serine/threonine-protein kinase
VHKKGIVHRDIKPRNVMILEGAPGTDDVVKLIDFGLAKVPVSELSAKARDHDVPSLTQAGVVMGTVAYMAPETAFGMSAVQARADLYSLGLVLYEMLGGKHPFEAEDPALLFALQRAQPPPPIEEHTGVRVPPALERVVMRLLEKDPAARYESAEALIDALDASLRDDASHAEPAPAARPSASAEASVVSKAPPRARRSNVAVWVLVALLVALAVVLAVRRPIAASAPPGLASAEAPHEAGSPSAAASGAPAAGADARLAAAVELDGAAAARVLLELARSEPQIFAAAKARASAAAAAQKAASVGGHEVDELFEVLATKLGAPGLDVLYELVQGDEASKGAERARNWLGRREVLEAGSPAMKIAYELLRTTCSRRQFLFPRAGDEGDERALALLTAMQPPACDSLRGQCCFKRHGDLERAVLAIQTRLGAAPP